MFWSMLFGSVSFFGVYSTGTFTDFTITDCYIDINSLLANATGYEITITREDDPTFSIQVITTENSFTFVAKQPGVSYTLTVIPLYDMNGTRTRGNEFKEHNVYVQGDCSEHSATPPKTEKDFYISYFWASVITFPLVIGGGLLVLYVWLRRIQGTTPANVGDQGTRRSVSVNSLCYANNSENHYNDESHYSLAK